MRARLFRDGRESGSVAVNPIQMSLDRRSLKRGEVDPVVFLVDADDRLVNPERNSTSARERPLPFRDLILERPIRPIAVEVHESVPFGRPYKVLTVRVEVEVVIHVYPAR